MFRLSFARSKKPELEVTDEMISLAQVCLPPKVPPPIKDKGESDVSAFMTTFNLKGIRLPLSQEKLAYWLPLGYDIYCIAMQVRF